MSNTLSVEKNIKKKMLIHYCPLLDTSLTLSERQQNSHFIHATEYLIFTVE